MSGDFIVYSCNFKVVVDGSEPFLTHRRQWASICSHELFRLSENKSLLFLQSDSCLDISRRRSLQEQVVTLLARPFDRVIHYDQSLFNTDVRRPFCVFLGGGGRGMRKSVPGEAISYIVRTNMGAT